MEEYKKQYEIAKTSTLKYDVNMTIYGGSVNVNIN